MLALSCAICGSKQKIVPLYPATFNPSTIDKHTFSARRTPEGTHYRFVQCQNCGLIFSNPILEPAKIAKLYQDSDFYYRQEADYLKTTYGELLPTVRPKSRLLDIGCGNGFFLEEAKLRGVARVEGVEPGKPSVEQAPKWLKKHIKISLFKPRLYPAKSFNYVTCFHTLDHVIDPAGLLREVYKILKPGGYAIFVVHDTDGLSVKLFGQQSAIFDIEHIYLFNQQTLARIFAQAGFRQIEVRRLTNTYPLKYWFKMIPLPNALKSLIQPVLAILKLADLPLSIQAGNISVVAQKP